MYLAMGWICLFLQASAPQPTLLHRIRAHMAEILGRMPDYTCRETIKRNQRGSESGSFVAVDTVRVEVSYVGGKELFAWPGADKFEEKTKLSDLVRGGSIGTGSFALHSTTIFQSDAPTFSYVGETTLDGHPAVQFAFEVPRLRSKYLVATGSVSGYVGYHGWFWADPDSLDVLRLQLMTDDVPEELGIRQITETLEYSRQRIGGASFLLPLSSEMMGTFEAGSQWRNRLRFDRCRQYTGESSIHFAEDTDAPSAAAPLAEAGPLPPNLTLEMVLTSDIDMVHAAIGDPVSATLLQDVKQGGVVLAPKGATLSGRITWVTAEKERRLTNYVVAIRLDTLRTENTRRPLRAVLDSAGMPEMGISVANAEEGGPGEGVIIANPRKSRSVLRNLRMVWRTVE